MKNTHDKYSENNEWRQSGSNLSSENNENELSFAAFVKHTRVWPEEKKGGGQV